MTASAAALKSCCANLYELPITSVLLGASFHPGGPRLTKELATMALVGRDSHVLDVASGSGESARTVASHFGCRVEGIDLSELSTQRARAITAEAGLGERVSFVVGDAERLPQLDATFDIVLCECALCTFPDMAAALSEMQRVLQPRGRIAISDVVITAPIPDELDNVMSHVLCIRGALSADGYLDALRDAGLSNVRHRDASHVLLDMVAGIEQRIPTALRLAEAGELELPDELDDPGPVLAAARDFIASGGAGYALFTARR